VVLITGTRLGPYEIHTLLGQGGMGQVYGARDTRLDREVAVKVLSEPLASDQASRERFEREARSAAAINHPHICTIFDVGPNYLVMERLEGETLAEVLTRGPLPLTQAIDYGVQIADALAAAHAHGIVHRDLKPSNVMITATGAKVLDFGLAKQMPRIDATAATVTVTSVEAAVTQAGRVVGTAAYMSPEQAEGKALDARSDLFAFGVLVYEMLGGQRPFSGDTRLSTIAAVLKASPDPLRRLRRDVPAQVERIVSRCLEKSPDARYASAADVRRELMAFQTPPRSRHRARAVMVAAAGLILVISTLAVVAYNRAARMNWVEKTAVPQVARLLAEDRPFAALKLYREAERTNPASRALVAFSEALNAPPLSIQSTPPGAEVYLSDYIDAKVGDASWELLGVTPLKTDRIPYAGYYRIRVSKAGFASIERPFDPVALGLSPSAGHLDLTLQSNDRVPEGMIWVDAAAAGAATGPPLVTPAVIPAFWLDKQEVSNKQFKAFVDAGGYRTRTNWKEPFVTNGHTLQWDDAMSSFHDATSRAGPATWQLGTYPEGTSDLPVSGVSWYEAAAYCDFAQKSLPTAYHWYHAAAGVGLFSTIVQLSNFGAHGPQPVGRNHGLSQYGALDMAGNVKEWSASPAGTKRAILGGSWDESSYTFLQLDAEEPFERRATFGFRCARFVERPPALLSEALAEVETDRRSEKPVDDAAFRVYAALHRYDRTDLAAETKSVDDSKPYFRRETVTFRAAYGNDRVVAHLYSPKNTAPPYQIVLFVPSGNNFYFQSIDTLPDPFEFLVRAGRAVLVPAVQGTLERGPSPLNVGPNQMRDRLLQWSKDVQRSIDYLETRPEIDTNKLAFYGISYSAGVSPTLLAPEPRFKAAVLVSGGAWSPTAAEVDPWNYAPRVKVPVLMLNGRDDFIFPVDRAQIPLLRALGTPDKDKRHILFDGGHVNLQTRMDLIGEILRWLDRYLGPVNTTS
jgi:eukaryotic-like serine/threonine-protein kinase